MKNHLFLAGTLLILLISISWNIPAQTYISLVCTYTEELTYGPLSGRILLLVSQDTATDPDLPDPFHPFITFGRDFENWHPGETLVLNQQNSDCFLSCPDSLTGWIAIRAIVDSHPESSILVRDGTCFSDKIVARIETGKPNYVTVPITQMLRGRGFREKPNIRLLEVESPLLSSFYGKPTFIEAAVLLPDSYFTDSLRHYPTMFVFPGWGTIHTAVTQGTFQQKRYGMSGVGEEKIVVFLNQDCRYGFHVFADSKNNGPRATSFVTEFLPEFEAQYRAVPRRDARFLTGQSSGAWAALWLLINYPDTFGMAWAASPDPVDFSRFLNIDLYSPDASLYYDQAGSLRDGIDSDSLIFSLRDWITLEKALGDGGQFQSFEAVFGNTASTGSPDQMFDRETGAILPSALKSWEAYDINRILLTRGASLKTQLDGRITIVVAGDDPFFLDEPVKTLKETLDSVGIKADIQILDEGGHNTWSKEIREEMHQKMDTMYNTPYP
ncbi:MAG: hypothetical protein EOM90_13850 [Alphaproteobacteria bacterium]|nr:hypothetical protein [Alphaproteobacteria bacterium]